MSTPITAAQLQPHFEAYIKDRGLPQITEETKAQQEAVQQACAALKGNTSNVSDDDITKAWNDAKRAFKDSVPKKLETEFTHYIQKKGSPKGKAETEAKQRIAKQTCEILGIGEGTLSAEEQLDLNNKIDNAWLSAKNTFVSSISKTLAHIQGQLEAYSKLKANERPDFRDFMRANLKDKITPDELTGLLKFSPEELEILKVGGANAEALWLREAVPPVAAIHTALANYDKLHPDSRGELKKYLQTTLATELTTEELTALDKFNDKEIRILGAGGKNVEALWRREATPLKAKNPLPTPSPSLLSKMKSWASETPKPVEPLSHGAAQTKAEKALQAEFLHRLQAEGLPTDTKERLAKKQDVLENASDTIGHNFLWEINNTSKGVQTQQRVDRAWANAVKEFEKSAEAKVFHAREALEEYAAIYQAKGEPFNDGMRKLLANRGFTPAEINRFLSLPAEALDAIRKRGGKDAIDQAKAVWIAAQPGDPAKEVAELAKDLGVSEKAIFDDIEKSLTAAQKKQMEAFIKEAAPKIHTSKAQRLYALTRLLGVEGLSQKLEAVRNINSSVTKLKSGKGSPSEKAIAANIQNNLSAEEKRQLIEAIGSQTVTIANLFTTFGGATLRAKLQELEGVPVAVAPPVPRATGMLSPLELQAQVITSALALYNPESPQSFTETVEPYLKQNGFTDKEISLFFTLPPTLLEIMQKGGPEAVKTWTEISSAETTLKAGGDPAITLWNKYASHFGFPEATDKITVTIAGKKELLSNVIRTGGDTAAKLWKQDVTSQANLIARDVQRFQNELGLSKQEIVSEVRRQLSPAQNRRLDALAQEKSKNAKGEKTFAPVSLELLQRFLGPAELYKKLEPTRNLANQLLKKMDGSNETDVLRGALAALSDSDWAIINAEVLLVETRGKSREPLSLKVLQRHLGSERLAQIVKNQVMGKAAKALACQKFLKICKEEPNSTLFAEKAHEYLSYIGLTDSEITEFIENAKQADVDKQLSSTIKVGKAVEDLKAGPNGLTSGQIAQGILYQLPQDQLDKANLHARKDEPITLASLQKLLTPEEFLKALNGIEKLPKGEARKAMLVAKALAEHKAHPEKSFVDATTAYLRDRGFSDAEITKFLCLSEAELTAISKNDASSVAAWTSASSTRKFEKGVTTEIQNEVTKLHKFGLNDAAIVKNILAGLSKDQSDNFERFLTETQKNLSEGKTVNHLVELVRFLGPTQFYAKLKPMQDLVQNVENLKKGPPPLEEKAIVLGITYQLTDAEIAKLPKGQQPTLLTLQDLFGATRLNALLLNVQAQPQGDARNAALAQRVQVEYNKTPEATRGPFTDFARAYLKERGATDSEANKFLTFPQETLDIFLKDGDKAADKWTNFKPALNETPAARITQMKQELEGLAKKGDPTIAEQLCKELSAEQNTQLQQLVKNENLSISISLLQRFLGPAKLAQKLEELKLLQTYYASIDKEVVALSNKTTVQRYVKILRSQDIAAATKQIVRLELVRKGSDTVSEEDITNAIQKRTNYDVLNEVLGKLEVPSPLIDKILNQAKEKEKDFFPPRIETTLQALSTMKETKIVGLVNNRFPPAAGAKKPESLDDLKKALRPSQLYEALQEIQIDFLIPAKTEELDLLAKQLFQQGGIDKTAKALMTQTTYDSANKEARDEKILDQLTFLGLERKDAEAILAQAYKVQ